MVVSKFVILGVIVNATPHLYDPAKYDPFHGSGSEEEMDYKSESRKRGSGNKFGMADDDDNGKKKGGRGDATRGPCCGMFDGGVCGTFKRFMKVCACWMFGSMMLGVVLDFLDPGWEDALKEISEEPWINKADGPITTPLAKMSDKTAKPEKMSEKSTGIPSTIRQNEPSNPTASTNSVPSTNSIPSASRNSINIGEETAVNSVFGNDGELQLQEMDASKTISGIPTQQNIPHMQMQGNNMGQNMGHNTQVQMQGGNMNGQMQGGNMGNPMPSNNMGNNIPNNNMGNSMQNQQQGGFDKGMKGQKGQQPGY